MPDEEFVKKMKAALRKQQEQAELAVKNNLHNVEVIKTDGPHKWDVLSDWIKRTVGEINAGLDNFIEYSGEGFSLRLSCRAEPNSGRSTTATLQPASGTITYQGSAASGSFVARVVQNELEYSWQQTVSSRGVTAAIGAIGSAITIDKMAEVLISSVVAP